MKYSVIIPIYNAENTLTRCLDSLVIQMCPQAEVLLIDDGSTDGSAGICKAYADRCPEIRLFKKENGGVSSARNLGLEQARGEYILFVDADDAVSEEYFSALDDALREKPELLLFSAQIVSGSTKSRRAPCRCESVFRGSRAISALASALRRQEFNLITTKAFRRDLIEAHHIRFDERLDIGEDKVFSFAYAVQIDQFHSIADSLYLLSMDGRDSLSRKKRDNLLDSVLLEHRILLETLEKAGLSEKEKRIYNQAIQYSCYRSAYTVCRKTRQNGLSASSRKDSTAQILCAYSRDPAFHPAGIACGLIALPVRMRWSHAVNTIVSFSLKESGT